MKDFIRLFSQEIKRTSPASVTGESRGLGETEGAWCVCSVTSQICQPLRTARCSPSAQASVTAEECAKKEEM